MPQLGFKLMTSVTQSSDTIITAWGFADSIKTFYYSPFKMGLSKGICCTCRRKSTVVLLRKSFRCLIVYRRVKLKSVNGLFSRKSPLNAAKNCKDGHGNATRLK